MRNIFRLGYFYFYKVIRHGNKYILFHHIIILF